MGYGLTTNGKRNARINFMKVFKSSCSTEESETVEHKVFAKAVQEGDMFGGMNPL